MNIHNECWLVVCNFIEAGEVDKAIALCESDRCSNSVDCQRYLGWEYYAQGNMEKSLIWFLKAVDQNDVESLFGAGSVEFCEKNYISAICYFKRAAENGYPRAYQWIANIYCRTEDFPVNVEEALKYYKKGASHGFLMSKRAIISIDMKSGNIFIKLVSALKLIFLMIEMLIISFRDINDIRMSDVPNVFEKK